MNRRPVPFDLGPVHFVGIGGIGMSAIAEIMLRIGYEVQGSDVRAGANTERLEKLGAKVFIGHAAEHVEGASALVFTSAVKADNPELAAARERRIPLVRRAEMLAELMRQQHSVAVGGTHGKTTTTSMVAAILDAADFDPTVVNGGIINAYGANAKVGAGDWIVVEADESDGTFLRLRPTVAVVTNIDPEHLDHYGDFEAVKRAFQSFVESIPFYGFAAVCVDDPDVQEMAAKVENRRLITYGTHPQAQIRATNLGFGAEGSTFDVAISGAGDAAPTTMAGMRLPMAGQHNVLNALAAIAVGRELGASEAAIRKGLAEFGGVRRRFTFTGEARGVKVVDDYGHHPVEIEAVLKAARAVTNGRVIAVVQPHRYSRTQHLWDEFRQSFNQADILIVTDIYAAGEAPIEHVNGEALAMAISSAGHKNVVFASNMQMGIEFLLSEAKPGDAVLAIGAGSVGRALDQLAVLIGAQLPEPEHHAN